MNQYVTGAVIRELREKHHMTQAELAEKLCLSHKTISKWETGKGYPDITLLEPAAKVFQVSVSELLAGVPVENSNVSANMQRSRIYVCPVCGNIIHTMGDAAVSCHGITLYALEPEEADENHNVNVEIIENEYFVSISHEMSKQHYISFIAAVSPDRMQLVKTYPEGNAEARFAMSGVRELWFFCNRDGLFRMKLRRTKQRRSAAEQGRARREAGGAAGDGA